MTVCVAVAVNDCLVFAADSASTLVSTDMQTGESRILNVYRHGDKVYNLYRQLPICAMTSGMGNIGTASVATLAKELRRRLTSGPPDWAVDRFRYTMADVARKARTYLFEECFGALEPKPPAPHSFEFWIGGYGSDRTAGHELWKVRIVNGSCPDPEPLLRNGETGLYVGGQTGPVARLVGGFDPGLSDALIEGGMDPTSTGVGRVPEGQARGDDDRPDHAGAGCGGRGRFPGRHDQALFPFPARSRYRGRQDRHRRGHAVRRVPLGPAKAVLFRNPERAGGRRWLTRRDLS